MQCSLPIPARTGTRISHDGIEVTYTPGFVDHELGQRLFAAILEQVVWERPTVRVFGREYLVPRHVAWHADAKLTYRYSGQEQPWRPWTPALSALRELVQEAAGAQHGVLANLYEDGSHSMGMHADDEADLETGAPVLMVSLGATRNFVLKHRTTQERFVLPLEHGSLLTMGGDTNLVAVHGVPKTARPVGPRMSLTFRRMSGI